MAAKKQTNSVNDRKLSRISLDLARKSFFLVLASLGFYDRVLGFFRPQTVKACWI